MNNTPNHANDLPSGRGSRQSPVEAPNYNTKRKIVKKKLFMISAGIIVLIALIVVGGLSFFQSQVSNYIEDERYQAVFLTNGQVYFGKLHKLGGGYFKLDNIFYLQTTASDSNSVQDASNKTNDVQLIKLGNEIHGPEDEMIVDKSQILFFENIKNDSKVTQAITKYIKEHK